MLTRWANRGCCSYMIYISHQLHSIGRDDASRLITVWCLRRSTCLPGGAGAGADPCRTMDHVKLVYNGVFLRDFEV